MITQVKFIYQSFLSLAKSQIQDLIFLNMISYHEKDGKLVQDAITAPDALVDPGTCLDGLFFTKLQCDFDFGVFKKNGVSLLLIIGLFRFLVSKYQCNKESRHVIK